MTDPQQHMPPRCCTQDHIPSKYVELLFDRDFRIKWASKYKEYTTKDRYYCPSQRYGQWIKPSNVIKDHNGKPKYGRCSRCRTKVCCLCRGRWHGSRGECPKDENVQKLEAIAKENGWQRCYNCSSIVELKDGCNHMTCRCKAEFCMRCAKKWKTCDCPWFNHNTVPDYDEEAVEFDEAGIWYTDSDDEDEEVDDWFRRVVGQPAYRRQEDFAQQYILQQVIRYRDEFHERLVRGVPVHPESEQARFIRFAARGLRV
ncbi:hypothetical protein DPV78_012698 [Talaromyces pinophilus]|nr:hypothetical protein DPV78_012698 [Talaromyces pinophilus]